MLLSLTYGVEDFKEEFSAAPGSDLNIFWKLAPSWDGSPFYQDYNGYGQWIIGLENTKQLYSACGLEYQIGQGDFEAIVKIANADLFEGAGPQLFLMNIWDEKPTTLSAPHYGLWVEAIKDGDFEGINVYYRNGNETLEEEYKKAIHEGSYIKFQFPISLRITWEENSHSFSFYYGMEGKYPDNLLATTIVYSRSSDPKRYGSLSAQQKNPEGKRSTYYIDSFQISGKKIADKPSVSETLKGTVSGAWNFKNKDLKADVGKDLELLGQTTKDKIHFGTTEEFGISEIGGKPANVLKFDALNNKEAIAVYPGTEANGGGSKINQYSILMDVMFDQSETKWWSILQTDPYNSPSNWAEFYYADGGSLQTSDTRFYGIGTGGAYFNPNTPINPQKWYRLAIVVDLTGPYIYNYVNGNFIGQQGAKERIGTIDGLLSLSPQSDNKPFLLFTENEFNDPMNSYTGSGYLASLQIRPYKMDAGEISALGRPTADGIPTEKGVQRFNTIDEQVQYGTFNTTLVWNEYQSGIEKIKSNQKPGLILFTHNEIVACKKIDRYFEESNIKNLVTPFELIKIEAKKERELSIQYGVYRVPTLVLVNSQNKVMKKWVPKANEVTQTNILNFFRNI